MKTGASIGSVMGMVAGIVIWKNKPCYGLDCAAKAIALPMFMICYTVIGGVVGAGMGYVVGSTQQGDYRQLPRTPSTPQFHVGVSLAF